MVNFAQTVAIPSTRDYAPPTPDIFAQIANMPNAYYQGAFNKQQREMNDQAIRQGQTREAIQQTFRGGLPTNADGSIDYGRAVAMLAQKGDTSALWNGADAVNQQRAGTLSPMLSGGGQVPAHPAGPAPVSATAAKIVQAESGGDPNAKNPNSTAAGLGQFTDGTWLDAIKRYFPNLAQGRSDDQLLAMRKIPQLAMRVTEAFTAGNEAALAKAGLPVTAATTYLAHFAGLGGAIKVLRADPNTPVSKILDQAAIKANPFLKDMTAADLQAWAARKMAGPAMVAQNAQPAAGNVASGPQGNAPASFQSRFAAASEQPAAEGGPVQLADASGSLPPSANAGTPAATRAPPAAAPQAAAPQAAPNGAPVPQAAPPVPPQAAAAQPPQAAPQGRPIVPQVPLPKGFTDPQAAILALRSEAAQLAANPRARGQVQELDNWASRIEESIKPLNVNPNTSMVDPRTGQVLYEGPAAAALRATEQAGGSPTLDADAERYRQTGQLPPNLKSNLMGQAESRLIRQRAAQIEQEAGGDPGTWPQKWQQFKAQQVAIQRFTSGPQGNTIRSFNVLVDHLDTLNEAAEGLKNRDNRIINRFVNNWKATTGDPAPTNFDGVKALVGDEIVKAVVGSAGALADREEVKKDLDRASSPQQLAQLVEKYKKLALGQLHGLQKQYETATGLKNFSDMLLPGTLKALGGASEGAGKSEARGTVSKDGYSIYTTSSGKKVRVLEETTGTE